MRAGAITERAPLWHGRALALIGIVLVAINLRTAVSGISPIVAQIQVDVRLDSLSLGILGSVPPVVFALSAVFMPLLSRRIGLERLLLIAIVAMVAGHLMRSLAGGFPALIAGTVLTIAGAGVGNVLLPPIVKRYFPDRVGLLTSIYALLLAVSSAVPAVIATPVADASGWRFSLAIWSIFSAVAAIPWIGILVERRREHIAVVAGDESPELAEPDPDFIGRIWHSKVAWSIALVFATSTLSVYAVFAWLPQLLVQTAGVTPAAAGALLALNSIVGAPNAILMPMLTLRIRRVGILVQIGVAAFVIAYLGLLFFPTTLTWLWVVFLGIGPLMFPVCLTLINLRTRTQRGSVALSGFAQAVGYTLGALGPLLVGVLHSLTGGWVAPLVFLLAVTAVAAVVATRLSRPTFVEDELAARAGGSAA